MIFFVVFVYDQLKSFICNNKEGFDVTSDIKAEINKIYNADIQAIRNLSDIATKLMAGGISVPGNLNINDNLILDGANKWIFHTPDDNRRILYIAPSNGKDSWDWGKSTTINNDGNVNINGQLSTNGSIYINGQLTTNGINTNTNPIYLWAPGDGNHFIGHSQGTRKWNDGSLNGPAVVGWSGGSLGSTNGGDKTTLTWHDTGNVSIRGGLRTGGGIGAFCIDSSGKFVPIFASTKVFNTFAMNDIDDAYVVFPGYKIEIFSSENYTNDGNEKNNAPLNTIDNTDGFNPIYKSLPGAVNSGSSCRLYYLGNEVIIDGIS